MTDISVNISGLRLSNPTVLASGALGWNGEQLKKCAHAGAGAVIPKTIAPKQIKHPRNGRMRLVRVDQKVVGMINLELFSTLPFERWLEMDLGQAAEGGAPIIASVLSDPDPAYTEQVVRRISDSGYVSMIELNVSCPMPVAKVGMHISRDPLLISEQVRAAKAATRLPVCVKLTPNFAYVDELAKAAESAGADALTVANSVQGLHGVDIERARLTMPAFGGYSGPAIKPINLKCTAQAARSVNIPIFGVGGISSWRDVVEYVMVGASAVQVCTAPILHGLQIFKEIADGLTYFMKTKGYESIQDFRGIALKHLSSAEQLAELKPQHAVVDQYLCNGCGMCVRACLFGAMDMAGKKAASNPDRCDACGLCVEFCPLEAVSLVE
jgi:dihydropyrimidine dehydrogenase (NAD+) subunit PreA